MKTIFICEGSTDLVFIQYFLQKANDWEYVDKKNYAQYGLTQLKFSKSYKWLRKKDEDKFLCICASGGSTKIPKVLGDIWNYNVNMMDENEVFKKIILLTDNDDYETEGDFIGRISNVLVSGKCQVGNLNINEWNSSSYNWYGKNLNIEILPLCIPFETTGAIEDFLLSALKEKSEAEDEEKIISKIVDKCSSFIDDLDCGDKYLTKRREKTKARFSSVFVVLTPADAFSERRNLLQSVPWEDYQQVQLAFKELVHI